MRDKHDDRAQRSDRSVNDEGRHNPRITQSADESDDFITDAEMEVREANGGRDSEDSNRSSQR